jgi:putative FmdB family regulatory protein
MPIYDYQCQRCRKRSEILVLPNQKQPPACPACGSTDLAKQFSGVASVTTTRTRERSAAVARSRYSAEKKEKDHAHAEYLRKHERDHS